MTADIQKYISALVSHIFGFSCLKKSYVVVVTKNHNELSQRQQEKPHVNTIHKSELSFAMCALSFQ